MSLSHTMKWTPTNQADEGPVSIGRWDFISWFFQIWLIISQWPAARTAGFPSMWFSALHFNAFTTLHSQFANEQIRIRWPEDAGTAAQFVCVRCCGLTHTGGVSVCDGLVSSPDTTSYSRVNKSPVWRRQRTRNKIERNCCSTPRREPRLLMTPHTRWESLQIRVKHTISQVSLESPTESWELRLGRQHAEMCW